MAVVEVLGGLNGGGRMQVDGLVGWFVFFF